MTGDRKAEESEFELGSVAKFSVFQKLLAAVRAMESESLSSTEVLQGTRIATTVRRSRVGLEVPRLESPARVCANRVRCGLWL